MKALFLLLGLQQWIQETTSSFVNVPSSGMQYRHLLKRISQTSRYATPSHQQQTGKRKRKSSSYVNHSKKTFSATNTAFQSEHDNDYDNEYDDGNIFSNIIQRNDFGKRLITIETSNLPIVADVHANGKWQPCIILGFKVPASIKSIEDQDCSTKAKITPPLLQVVRVEEGINYLDEEVFDSHCCVVDIGQITCVWDKKLFSQYDDQPSLAIHLSRLLSTINGPIQKFPVNHVEKTMQTIYDQYTMGRRSVGPTKKDINKISTQIEESEMAQHLEQLLKRGLKAGLHGKNYRLLDSDDVSSTLFNMNNKSPPTQKSSAKVKLVGSKLIARDAELGGRFKRSGCIFVSTHYEQNSIHHICLLNGGWTAVDTSVKAGTEARKFVQRQKIEGGGDNPNDVTTTTADERILHRLECFAMGEVSVKEDGSNYIDLDIREALSALNLPHTTEGAQKALIQSGRWSAANVKTKSNGKVFEPWSNDILESSRLLAKHEEKRRLDIFKKCMQNNGETIDGRTNLMALPSICIDAKRASFRDDAIGLRPRSSTGRKVVDAASKWEILVHIADVSDVYLPDDVKGSTNDNFDYTLLRKAAETRAASRYDLPFGPLHLMPPVALDALALVTRKINNNKTKLPPVNRCVTLWAYIDERNGKLIDAGVERSIISAPIALSFNRASAILDGNVSIDSKIMKQVQAILTISERTLSKWKDNRLSTDEAASKREQRLQMREIIAKEVISPESMRDDGSKGSFQRTRGHRLVDQSLNLYGNTISKMLSRARAAIPRASGSSAERDARVATAPLRRYVDGIAQRQALSVLCNFGGPALTRQDCDEVNKQINEATKTIRNNSSPADHGSSKRKKSLQKLENHLSSLGASTKRVVPALSTGKANDVVISGLGLSVKCRGVEGSLKSGERVSVEIMKLDAENGILRVRLDRRH